MIPAIGLLLRAIATIPTIAPAKPASTPHSKKMVVRPDRTPSPRAIHPSTPLTERSLSSDALALTP
jgi:hypothetical protein